MRAVTNAACADVAESATLVGSAALRHCIDARITRVSRGTQDARSRLWQRHSRDTRDMRDARDTRALRHAQEPPNARGPRTMRHSRTTRDARSSHRRGDARDERPARNRRDGLQSRHQQCANDALDAHFRDPATQVCPARSCAAARVRSCGPWGPGGWCPAPRWGVGGSACRRVPGMAARARAPGHRPPQPAQWSRERST